MVFTGADLIRTSGQVSERAERFKVHSGVPPVAPQDSGASLTSDDSQNALLRFARFITDEKKKKPKVKALKPSTLPSTYLHQLSLGEPDPVGQGLDIRI